MTDGDDGLGAPPPLRQIPHNIEAEMALLGAMLINPKAIERTAFLRSEHFAVKEHRAIFDEIARLTADGRLADTVSLRCNLAHSDLDGVGGAAYLNRLVDSAVTLTNACEYGRIVHELYLRREWIALGEAIVSHGYSSSEPALPTEVQDTISQLSSAGMQGLGLNEMSFRAVSVAEVPPRDLLLGGWLSTESIAFVVGGDKTGKSFLALEIACAVASGRPLLHWQAPESPRRVLYIDGEMGTFLVKDRLRTISPEPPDSAYLAPFDSFRIPPIETTAGHAWVLGAADEVDADLVVLDNFTALTNDTLKDDNVIKAVRPLLQSLVASGRGVLGVLHTGHDKTRYAGSAAIGAITTSILHLEKDATAATTCGTVTWQSTRYAEPGDDDYKPFPYAVINGRFVKEEFQGRATPKNKLVWDMFTSFCATHAERRGSSPAPSVSVAAWRGEYTSRLPGASQVECDKETRKLIESGHVSCLEGRLWAVQKKPQGGAFF